jgi:amino acid transporter
MPLNALGTSDHCFTNNLNGMTSSCFNQKSSSPFLRKPIHILRQEQQHDESRPVHHDPLCDASSTNTTASSSQNRNKPHRHLTLLDLIVIGVGGTVGSGLFVLTGQIASHYSGASTWVSFALAGLAATTSGLCFAELSGRLPVAGSTYAYAHVCLGELAAVIAAACLTLEYAVSGAAVARSWGDKVSELKVMLMNGSSVGTDQVSGAINLPAFLVSSVSTILLLAGVQESKTVTNFITAFKMLIVIFMTVGGFALFHRQNMKPLAPFGTRGVVRGATTSFFGYLGFDEVCCVASEAIHPEQDMPRAVIGTLVIVTCCYVMASLALTGMLPYDEISPTSGFPDAFYARGVSWAGTFTAIGEIVTLPVVVIISLMAQPRLTYSMAQDGLLPAIFANLDAKGNLFGGTAVAGALMTLLATFVPFTYLNDLVSAGILVAFCMTCSCLVLLRCESPPGRHHVVERFLVLYHGLCFSSAILWSHDIQWFPWQWLWASMLTVAALGSVVYLAMTCPRPTRFGGSILPNETSTYDPSVSYFQTPLVPYLPCIGMAINWFLIAQLDTWGILFLILYLGVNVILYLWKCAPRSVGHQSQWITVSSYHGLSDREHINVEEHIELEKYRSGSESTGILT